MRRVRASAGERIARALCLTLLSAAALAAQQGGIEPSWSQRRPSPQTSHSRLFTQRSAASLADVRHVIIVSVDGMMPEAYLNPDAHGLKVPTLRRIVRRGAYSEGAQGVFPTVTYPSHTSMVTGVNPGTHGIMANGPWDPLGQLPGAWRWYAEDIRVPTLWDAARAKGLTTALVFWPVTVGARATAIVPEFWRQEPGTPEDAKLNFALSTPGLLDAVAKRFPDFRTRFVPPGAHDEPLTDVAVQLIETLQPNLLLLHIFDVDHWQHEDGPFAGRALAALETADQQIARVIAAAKKAGIWKQTVLVVLSDHGFALTSQRLRPGVWLREKGKCSSRRRPGQEAASGKSSIMTRLLPWAATRKPFWQSRPQRAGRPAVAFWAMRFRQPPKPPNTAIHPTDRRCEPHCWSMAPPSAGEKSRMRA